MGIFKNIFNQQEQPQQMEERSNITTLSIPIFKSANNKMISKYFQIPSFSKAHNLITSNISSLPIYLYKEDKNGNIKRIYGDVRERMLNEQPNDFQTSYNYKEKIISDLLLKGESLSLINKKGNKIKSLHNVDSFTTKSYCDDKGIIVNKTFNYTMNNRTFESDYYNFIHPIYSQGVNSQWRTLDGILEEYAMIESIYNNVSAPKGIIKTEGRLTGDAITKLKEAWNNLYTGRNNIGKTIVLENGLDYVPLKSVDLSEINIDEIETNITKKVAQVFGIPYKILSNEATLEDNSLFLASVTGLITSLEQSINSSILTEIEKAEGYFFAFSTEEFIRMNETEKNDIIIKQLNSGIISMNEARYKLNFDSIERNYTKIGLGEALHYEDNNEIFIVNLGTKLDTEENTNNEIKEEVTVE